MNELINLGELPADLIQLEVLKYQKLAKLGLDLATRKLELQQEIDKLDKQIESSDTPEAIATGTSDEVERILRTTSLSSNKSLKKSRSHSIKSQNSEDNHFADGNSFLTLKTKSIIATTESNDIETSVKPLNLECSVVEADFSTIMDVCPSALPAGLPASLAWSYPDRKSILNIQGIENFCFPSGVAIDFTFKLNAMKMIGPQFDKRHILQFSDERGLPTYSCCLIVNIAMPAPCIDLTQALLDIVKRRKAVSMINKLVLRFTKRKRRQRWEKGGDQHVMISSSASDVGVHSSSSSLTGTGTAASGNNTGANTAATPGFLSKIFGSLRGPAAAATAGGPASRPSVTPLKASSTSSSAPPTPHHEHLSNGSSAIAAPINPAAVGLPPLKISQSYDTPAHGSHASGKDRDGQMLYNFDIVDPYDATATTPVTSAAGPSTVSRLFSIKSTKKPPNDVPKGSNTPVPGFHPIAISTGGDSTASLAAATPSRMFNPFRSRPSATPHAAVTTAASTATSPGGQTVASPESGGNSPVYHMPVMSPGTTDYTGTLDGNTTFDSEQNFDGDDDDDGYKLNERFMEFAHANYVIVSKRAYCIVTSQPQHAQTFQVLQAMADAERGILPILEGISNNVDALTKLSVHELCAVNERNYDDCRMALLDGICKQFLASSSSKSRPSTAAAKKQSTVSVPGYVPSFSLQNTLAYPSIEEWSSAVMFSHLGSQVIAKIINLLLTEKSLIVCGHHAGIVTAVSIAITGLLAPFGWEGVFVPLVPDDARELFGAPVPFILGTTSPPRMTDMSPSAAVLMLQDNEAEICKQFARASIFAGDYDEDDDDNTNYNFRADKADYVAWFTRLPDITADLPLNHHLDKTMCSTRDLLHANLPITRHLEYLRNQDLEAAQQKISTPDALPPLVAGSFLKRHSTSSSSKPCHQKPFHHTSLDVHFISNMTIQERESVREALHSIHKSNMRFCGDLTDPVAWRHYLKYNPNSKSEEFQPDLFMEPLRSQIEFQETVVHTQHFVTYFDRMRSLHNHKEQCRLFLHDWIYFRWCMKKKIVIYGAM